VTDRRAVGVAAASLQRSYVHYFGPRQPRPTRTEIQAAMIRKALEKLKAR
jgi:hypothetical protein